jgi:transcriptional regulator with XRE-family HTH domain
MDDRRVGRSIRVLRARRGWRQKDLARAAGVSRQLVSKVELGKVALVQLGAVRVIVEALGCRFELFVDSPGRDLDRLLNAGHAAMHEAFARLLRSVPGWLAAPESSFAIYGERGVIDVLAFHQSTGSLLVVELKTAIMDVNDLLATMDRRRRLAPRIARDRHWDARSVSTWILVADSATNRRRLAAHATVLRGAFPADGRQMRGWLTRPSGAVAALSFLARAPGGGASARIGPVRRPVRPPPVPPERG